jgi:anaerobic selenocysteine-containing dehydrogenase
VHLRSEVAIVCGLARATLGAKWAAELPDDYDRIRDAIANVVPGFADFNARVRAPGGGGGGGGAVDNPARRRIFATATGKARFTVQALPRIDLGPGQLLLTTVRSHDQFNTTVYGADDRYRGVYGHRRVVFLHADDIAALGLQAGQRVTLTSHFQGRTRSAPDWVVVPYDVPRRTAVAYFPEANVLVPADSFADGSRTPTSKSVVVTIG